LAECVYDFFAMSHIGLLTDWNILVPKVTPTHIFEPKVLARRFNEFQYMLGVGIHELCACGPDVERDTDKPRQGVVASMPNLFRNGAVAFIDWLGVWMTQKQGHPGIINDRLVIGQKCPPRARPAHETLLS
jgi:hypothetical protein